MAQAAGLLFFLLKKICCKKTLHLLFYFWLTETPPLENTMSDEIEVQALSVPIPPQPETIIVVDAAFLTRLNELGGQVAALSVIETDAQNEAAADLLKLVTGLEKQVEENATEANKPYHAITKAIGAAKAQVAKPLGNLKASLKASLSGFVIKRENERLAAERKAADERARQQAEVDALNKSRAEAAAAAGGPAPVLLAAPSVIVTKPPVAQASAVKVQKKMVVTITDPAAVPREFCVPDVKLVEDAWKRGQLVPEFHPFFKVEEVVSVSAK